MECYNINFINSKNLKPWWWLQTQWWLNLLLKKKTPPSYCELRNNVTCWWKQHSHHTLGTKECIRIPNTTCDEKGCNNGAYGYCNGQYKFMYANNGALGPTLWNGCGRMLCQAHMSYYNWGDGQNHLTCCKDRAECEGAVINVMKHNKFGCFCP